MDTPNINGAKTTTLPATLAGGWYTQLTERTKRSRHSWSMIPFTEPQYSVPDGNSRKVGEANIPTIFSVQTAPDRSGGANAYGQGNGAQPDSLRRAIDDMASALDGDATVTSAARNFAKRAAFLQEELVRYIATGTSLAHLDPQIVEASIDGIMDDFVGNNDDGTAKTLDVNSWIGSVMQQASEIRFNEWGAGGPVAWLYEVARLGDIDDARQIRMTDVDASFTGRRLKAPVMCHYINDPRVFANPLAQAEAVGGGIVEMDIAAMTGAGLQIVYAMNIDDASAMISSDPFGNTIAVYAHNRDCHVLVHPSLYNQYGYRLRRILQDLGPFRPSVSHLGLGHLEQRRGNNQTMIRPTLGWSVGQLHYNGNNYRADGNVYIPSDYHPYSLLKRTAKFNHIVTQVGSAWMGSFGSYGCGNEDGVMPRRALNESIAPMVQLLWGEQFGYTASPSIPMEPFFEPETIAQRMDEHLISTFGSGILAFDSGIGLTLPLNAMNAMLDSFGDGDGEEAFLTSAWCGVGDAANMWTEALGTLGMSRSTCGLISAAFGDLEAFGVSRSIEHVWSAVKAAIGPLFQVPLTPMTMLHSGGPRPGHVVERLQMNFRPDMAVSGGTAGTKPYFLMPTQLNPGQTLVRLPCYLDMTVEAATSRPNTWLGPRDPTVLTGVETVHYDGDRPREMTDPDYALESPIIIRDASVGTLERNGRPVTIHRLPRPAYHRTGATFVGVFNTLTHGIESANGNYYLYPAFEGEEGDSLHYEAGRGQLVMTGVRPATSATFGGNAAAGAVLETNLSQETVGRNGQFSITNFMNDEQAGLPAVANGQSIGLTTTAEPNGMQEIPGTSLPGVDMTTEQLQDQLLDAQDRERNAMTRQEAAEFALGAQFGVDDDEVGDAA